MTKVNKAFIRKQEKALREANSIEYFVDSNDYWGGTFDSKLDDRTIRGVLQDIQLGFANLYEAEGHFVLKYSGMCKWILRVAA
jgi:hypothetical protein